MKGFRYSLAFRIGAAAAGLVLVCLHIWLAQEVAPAAETGRAWPLYLWSVGGFVGACFGAWGLRHGLGWLYGLGIGLLVGGPLCLMHGILAFTSEGCVLGGDHVAGLLFGLVSLLGGYLGTRGGGVRPYLVKGPLTWKRMVSVGLMVCAYAGVWVAAWLGPQIAYRLSR